MQMSDVLNNATDQDRGADLDLITPWDGKPTGMVLTIVGPDSATAPPAAGRRARNASGAHRRA